MNKTKRIIIAMLAVLLIATSVMLCACDNTPSEYKPKKFYGTYTQFANDYYFVTCGVYNEKMEWQQVDIHDEIVSIDGNTYVCVNSRGERIAKEADPRLLAKVQELMDKIGTSITVKKKEIICDDSGLVVEYDKTSLTSLDQGQLATIFWKNGKDSGIGFYEEDGSPIFYICLDDILAAEDGVEHAICISKAFIK